MHKNDVIDIGIVDIDVPKGQCRKRTWDPIDCGIAGVWCYVDDSNTCSDSKFSTEGSPYNWSCKACEESTWPYPAPRIIGTSTQVPESSDSEVSSPLVPAIVGSLAGCLCIAIALILFLVMKRRMQTAEKKGEEETKTEFNPMYGQYYFDDGTQCPNE